MHLGNVRREELARMSPGETLDLHADLMDLYKRMQPRKK